MKTLIVEDEPTSRLFLEEVLKEYGPVHIAVNGADAVRAAQLALEDGNPYDLICMDIMMPEMDGQQALHDIRAMEEAKGIFSTDGTKIIMTTVLGDMKNVTKAYRGLCDAYLTKPIQKSNLIHELHKLMLIP